MEKYVSWIKSYLGVDQTNGDLNYIEAALVDSLKFIELIESIESHFNVKFNDNILQDNRIATVFGLATIIAELKQS